VSCNIESIRLLIMVTQLDRVFNMFFFSVIGSTVGVDAGQDGDEVCMYVCISLFMYVCLSVCMYVCTYVYIFIVCMCACACVCV
jgi:hypothetical protein